MRVDSREVENAISTGDRIIFTHNLRWSLRVTVSSLLKRVSSDREIVGSWYCVNSVSSKFASFVKLPRDLFSPITVSFKLLVG